MPGEMTGAGDSPKPNSAVKIIGYIAAIFAALGTIGGSAVALVNSFSSASDKKVNTAYALTKQHVEMLGKAIERLERDNRDLRRSVHEVQMLFMTRPTVLPGCRSDLDCREGQRCAGGECREDAAAIAARVVEDVVADAAATAPAAPASIGSLAGPAKPKARRKKVLRKLGLMPDLQQAMQAAE